MNDFQAPTGPVRVDGDHEEVPRLGASDGGAGEPRSGLPGLSLLALGVVFGDIGTSPIYALREVFHVSHDVAATSGNVLGVLSLVAWSLILVISVKYIGLVMRADNDGEGGIIALTALVGPKGRSKSPTTRVLVLIGLFGAALLYGDSMITPSISVLSAVEGLAVVTPAATPIVLPLTIAILIGLFLLQPRGTERVGKIFGPVMLTWFVVLGLLGAARIIQHPGILAALSPHYAVEFVARNGRSTILVLGSVFLVVTGGEALYADMGHFGVLPIRTAWFAVVVPALLTNYFGQGAAILMDPAAVESPFFLLAPDWGRVPLVLLATAATVIASQAVISGAFSLTRQAVHLGYLPRLRVVHTSDREVGQVYLPAVNWTLMVSCVLLVVTFRTSSRLAGAYGVAVTTDMVFTTLLFGVVARRLWTWSRMMVALMITALLSVDLSFWAGTVHKLPDGGWVPLAIACTVFALMTTWRRGRSVLSDVLEETVSRSTLSARSFIEEVRDTNPVRVEGTAVFLDSNPTGVPVTVRHHLNHNHSLHERVIFLTVTTADKPIVPPPERVRSRALGEGVHRTVLRFGFAEDPDIPEALSSAAFDGGPVDMAQTTFFAGNENIISTPKHSMARWRERLFVLMSRNATEATRYFRIPSERVVELGVQVEI